MAPKSKEPKSKEPKKADRKKEDSPESSGRGTPESYELVNKDHHADTTSFIAHWTKLTNNKLRISYVSDMSGERFQAYLGDNPVYRPRYEDSMEKAMEEADKGLYKACNKHDIKLTDERTCIVH